MVHPSAELYGADRQFVESVRAVRGVADPYVVLGENGPLVDEFTGLGLSVEVVESLVLRRSLLGVRGLVWALLRAPVQVVRAITILRRVRPDLVYVNTVTLPLWSVAAAATCRPRLMHVHETINESGPAVNALLSLPVLLGQTVVYNSDAAKRAVRESNPLVARWRREVVVRNGLDESAFNQRPPAETGRSSVVALVGRLSPRKGTDVAVRAVMRLRKDGHDVTLHLHGSVYSGYEWFEQQLREMAAPDPAAVVFHGFTDRPAEAFATAHVVLVPSRAEPFGNVAVEAMLTGRAVVASDVGGLSEIVIDGGTGLLVQPDDDDALAAAVAKLLTDPCLRDMFGSSGRQRAVEQFGSSRYGERIRHEVAKICGLPKGGTRAERGAT